MAGGASDSPRRRLRVLIVDASEDVRLLLRGLLETRIGFVVVGEAADVETAIELEAIEQPDLVIVDAGLLGDGGPRVVATLADRPSSKVVVVFADASTKGGALLAAGAFMILDRAAALRIANILEAGVPSNEEQATVSIDRAVEISCRCDLEGCGGTIRFVAIPTRILTDGTALGSCMRCGAAYQLLNSMTELAPVRDGAAPAAHKLLNAASAALDAVRAARSQTSDPDDEEVGMLLDIAERQGLAVIQGLRELILGLPLGVLVSSEQDAGAPASDRS